MWTTSRSWPTWAIAKHAVHANGQQVKACIESGITPYLPQANTSANSVLGLFGKQGFHYDPAHDCYRCAAGNELTFYFETQEAGRHYRTYTTSACGFCPFKPRCTGSRGNRRITRWVDEGILEAMAERVRAHPEKVKLRKCLVEHPFGTVKRHWNQEFFLTRGLTKVKAEMGLTVLAHRSCSLTAQHPAGSEDPRGPPNDRSARLGALLPSLLLISHANSQHWPVASSLATEFSHGLARC